MKMFVLGGMRSGKSRWAEKTAHETGLPVIYVATARVLDHEMAARIDAHRARRPAAWMTVDAPLMLAQTLQEVSRADHCILVDCLTLWLTNLLVEYDTLRVAEEIERFLLCVPQLPGSHIFVGNETNLGVTPMGELTRQFCDTAGILHQRLAAVCDRVTFTVAGLPMTLKG